MDILFLPHCYSFGLPFWIQGEQVEPAPERHSAPIRFPDNGFLVSGARAWQECPESRMIANCPLTKRRGCSSGTLPGTAQTGQTARSEERRVGKECRSRWSPY